MTFNVKQYMADKKIEPYSFTDINGDKQQLPNLLLFTQDQVDKLLAGIETDPVAALGEIAPELVDTLKATPLLALRPLTNDYIDFCKEAAGEASASPGSSKSTARPSKRTSRATTPKTTRKR